MAAQTKLFDTLFYVTELEEVGVPPLQAKTQVKLLSEMLENTVCTKQDLIFLERNLKQEMSHLAQDVLLIESHLKKDMTVMESGIRQAMTAMESGIRQDMAAMESGIRQDMASMEANLKEDNSKLRQETIEMGNSLRNEMANLREGLAIFKYEIIKWFMGTFLLGIGTVVSLVKLLKFI